VGERQKIVLRLLEKQEKLIVAMRRDLQTEIKRGIQYYKVVVMIPICMKNIVIHAIV